MARTPTASGVRPSAPRGTPAAHAGSVDLDRLTRTLAALDRAGIERMMTAGQLAGMFAHELSNILTPLLSYAQLALAHPDDDTLARKALTKAADGATRAAFLADALLGKRGGPETRDRDAESAIDPLLGIAPVASVDECARRAAAASFRTPGAAADRQRILVHIHAPADLHAAIHAIALEHVLENLITNARLAMRTPIPSDTPGEISVQARPCSTGNTPANQVQIRVRDTGPGIPDSIRARLFEPFVTSRAGAGGFGLGLAVCRRLIEQAGGTITLTPAAEATPGAGAEFVITLPAARPPREAGASNADAATRRLAA